MSPSFLRANLLYNQGSFLEAEAELRAVLATGDDSAQVHALLGLCLLNARLLEEARLELETALACKPDDAFNYYAMSFVETTSGNRENLFGRRRVMLNPKLPHGSMQCALRAVELAPHNELYLVRLAEVFQLLGRWQESRDAALSALRLSPSNCPAAVRLSEALIKLHQSDEAKVVLRRALEANPEASLAHAGMGWALLRAGDRGRAEQFFNEALRMRAELRWAQEGVLECAKQKFRIHRWLVGFKRWFESQHWFVALVAGLALAAAVLAFLFGYFSLVDPVLRRLLGNEGFGVFTLAWLLGGCALIFYHKGIFLWMARRHAAAKTSVGIEHRRFDARMLVLMAVGVALMPIDIFLEKIATIGPPIFAALVPGVVGAIIAVKYFPAGKRRWLWLVYTSLVLLASPFAVVALYKYTGEIPKPIQMLVIMLLPYLPLFIASDAEHKRAQKKKHLDSVNAASRTKMPTAKLK